MQSICNSTAGAACQITFTKDGVTKSLDTAQTDNGGSVYWTWKLQDLGLTPGAWHIQATATLNGKSARADDPLTLDVQP